MGDEETRGDEIPTGADASARDEGDPAWLEECEFCGETFDSEEALREHKVEEHEAAKDEADQHEAAERGQREADGN